MISNRTTLISGMKTRIDLRSVCAALCISAFSAPGPVAAQESAPPKGTVERPAQPVSTPSTYDIEIKDNLLHFKGRKVGATVAEVVDALRDLYPDVNIVVAPNAASVNVADLKLRSARATDALEALRVSTGSAIKWTARGAGSNIDPSTGMPTPSTESSLYIIEADPTAEGQSPKRQLEVFNLSPFLRQIEAGKQTQEEALIELRDTIHETLAQLRGGGPAGEYPEFRFHKNSGLLVAIGDAEALEVARKVLCALPGVTRTEGAAPTAANTPEAGDAARERLMRRYGIGPAGAYGTASGGAPAAGVEAGGTTRNIAAEEAFRRRYNLPPATPAPVPAVPPPAKTPY
jgi:hypothetical protein